jgi:hypothetical protein
MMCINRPGRRTADLSTPLRSGRDDKFVAQENLSSRPEESWACGPHQGMKKLSVRRPLSHGSVALLFVIPSAAEGSAVLRTFPGNMESRCAKKLSSRPERSVAERSAVLSNLHVRPEGR